MSIIYGDTANLKASHVKALTRFQERRVRPDVFLSPTLATDLVALSHALRRQIGLFLDRRGRVERIILGDAHSLALPEFARVRGVAGRLRGIRLVVTHLLPEPITQEELADLSQLKLDALIAIHQSPAGIQVDLANLAPGSLPDKEVVTLQQWPRVPIAIWGEHGLSTVGNFPRDFTAFIQELEAELMARVGRAHAESKGVRAMVLQVHQGGPDVDARQHEMRELCRTLGLHLIDLVEQRRSFPDPRTFFGPGKLRDVLIQALAHDVELLICDPDLTPSQARTIAEITDLKVIDRTTLILDIFAQHAKSADGKLQVELAQLRYQLPKMVGHGTMMSRLAGGIGGRGPGETKLEIDRRRAKSRIVDLERKLRDLQKQRQQRRAKRSRQQIPVVAIVGYTNAGKSSLLNVVTNSQVSAENKLFATLDPTSRRLRFPQDREVILLDTVGFIRNLPPALLQAFSATLEEVASADLLLIVLDASDVNHLQHLDTVEQVLGELGAGQIPRFMVYNKCDLLSPQELEHLRASKTGPTFYISALDRRSTRPLIDAIDLHLWEHGRSEHNPLNSSPLLGDANE